jgi:hypothetical protein
MRISKIAAPGALVVLGLGFVTMPKANAEYTAFLYQDGSSVVVAGSGTINLSGVTLSGGDAFQSAITPSIGNLAIGSPNFDAMLMYIGVSAPSSFGPGGDTQPSNSGNGDKVAFYGDLLVVPKSYVSGSALSDSSTYDNTALAALGVTDGINKISETPFQCLDKKSTLRRNRFECSF